MESQTSGNDYPFCKIGAMQRRDVPEKSVHVGLRVEECFGKKTAKTVLFGPTGIFLKNQPFNTYRC
jgi:hypothetical protein